MRIFALKPTAPRRRLFVALPAGCSLELQSSAVPVGMDLHSNLVGRCIPPLIRKQCKETIMKWNKPEFSDLRFGFEVTMYIANR